MKTLRYLLALLAVSSLPLFSVLIPDARATPPSVMLGDSAKSDNEQVVENVGVLQDAIGPFATALSEDVLKLIQELAKKYKSVGEFTKDFDFKELGEWGKGLEFLGKILDITKYIGLIAEVIDSLNSGDEARFINAVDAFTRTAAIDVAKFFAGKGASAAGAVAGTAAGPIGTIIGKIGGGMMGEWLAEKAMSRIYDSYIKNTARNSAHKLFHKLKGGGAGGTGGSPGDLLPGVTTPGGGGKSGTGSGGGSKRSGQLNPVKIGQ
jgi:hypothetical protein